MKQWGLILSCVFAASAMADAPIEVKFATVAPPKTPWAATMETFAKNVERRSTGRLKVQLFLGGAMGDENTTARMAARGQLQAVAASTGAIASLVPELDAIEAPFLFQDAAEADHILDNVVMRELENRFRRQGLVLGYWSENGFRHFGTKWGGVLSPNDVKNRKVRSQENFTHIQMWKAFGAAAQAIPTTEVTTALKTGAVEGFDQALLYAIAVGWHTQIRHFTLSAHIYQPAVIVFSREWFDTLPIDLQQILIEEGRAVSAKGRADIRAMNPKMLGVLKQAKVQVHKLSPEQRAAFVAASAPVYEALRSRDAGTAQVLSLIEKGLVSFRARTK